MYIFERYFLILIRRDEFLWIYWALFLRFVLFTKIRLKKFIENRLSFSESLCINLELFFLLGNLELRNLLLNFSLYTKECFFIDCFSWFFFSLFLLIKRDFSITLKYLHFLYFLFEDNTLFLNNTDIFYWFWIYLFDNFGIILILFLVLNLLFMIKHVW